MLKNLIIDFMFLWNKYYFVCQQKSPLRMVVDSIMKRVNTETAYNRKILVLDGPNGSDKFKEILPAYKAKRGSKEHVYFDIDKCLQEISQRYPDIVILRAPNWEADQVIAALASIYSKKGEHTEIFSGDKDLLQLMSFDNVIVTETYKDTFKLQPYKKEITLARFKSDAVKEYSDIIKYRIFKGDASDGIPVAIPRLSTSTINTIVENWEGTEFNLEDIEENVPYKEQKKFELYKENLERNWNLMQLIKLPNKKIIEETEVYKQDGFQAI